MASPDGDDGEAMPQDFYATLNVPRDASDEDIRRAYRTLAQVYHPDKHQEPAQQERASAQFTRVLQAYEVLADPVKRDVYDVYGQEGLDAGLAVGEHLDRDALKREWEEYRRSKAAPADAAVTYHGAYVCQVDASAAVAPYAGIGRGAPEIAACSMSNTMEAHISQRDTAWAGGQVMLRRGEGEGGFVCGYRRQLTAYDALEVAGTAGLKSLLSVASTRQLTDHDTGVATLMWQPQTGVGLQLLLARELSSRWAGEFRCGLGPGPAPGMSVGLTWRPPGMVVGGRLEAGLAVGISARVAKGLTDTTTARARARVATNGWEIECGATRKVDPLTLLGLHVSAGTMGLQLRLTFKRGSQAFDFPIMLTPYLEPGLVAGAYLLPPLLIGGVKSCVWDPLQRWRAASAVAAARRQQSEATRKALKAAQDAQALLASPSLRKLRREAAAGGLVVVAARYGCFTPGDGWEREPRRPPTAHAAEQAPERGAAGGGLAGEAAEPGSGGGEAAAGEGGAPAGGASVAAGWLDVTVALRYLADGGKLTLYPGVGKSGLPGFADPCPRQAKQLEVLYLYRGEAYRVLVADVDGLQLPGGGERVADAERAAALADIVRWEGVELQAAI